MSKHDGNEYDNVSFNAKFSIKMSDIDSIVDKMLKRAPR